MAIDISKLGEKELKKLQGEIEKRLKSMDKEKISAARKAAEAAAKKHGFSLSDLVGGSKKSAGKKPGLPAKYKNPADASQTWSGRGRQPQWYKDAIAKGTDPKKLEV